MDIRGYDLGVPEGGSYKVVMNSEYYVSGKRDEYYEAIRENKHNQPYKIGVNIPPNSAVYIKKSGR